MRLLEIEGARHINLLALGGGGLVLISERERERRSQI